MKKLLGLMCVAALLCGFTGCQSNGCNDCNDGLFPSFGDAPRLGFLSKHRNRDCGCEQPACGACSTCSTCNKCSTCNTCGTGAPCSSCGGGYSVGYTGAMLEGNVIEGGTGGCATCGQQGSFSGPIMSSPGVSGPVSVGGAQPGPSSN